MQGLKEVRNMHKDGAGSKMGKQLVSQGNTDGVLPSQATPLCMAPAQLHAACCPAKAHAACTGGPHTNPFAPLAQQCRRSKSKAQKLGGGARLLTVFVHLGAMQERKPVKQRQQPLQLI